MPSKGYCTIEGHTGHLEGGCVEGATAGAVGRTITSIQGNAYRTAVIVHLDDDTKLVFRPQSMNYGHNDFGTGVDVVHA